MAADPPGPGELEAVSRQQAGRELLAHYELIEQAGRGGMGTVWRARDTLLDREVAVKILSDEWQADAELQERFVREARIIARLAHPNLPQIHFVGRAGGRLFFAMEWIEGETLEAMVRRGRLPVATALDLGRQVAEGLAAAHRAGIIHRDLKPSNIMVTPDGVAKILDFGIARSLAFGTGATVIGAFIGTPHYASPEQASGQKLDARSDLYSLGATLYELLSGEPPFQADSALAVLTARLMQPPPELPESTACGPEVRGLIRALMARERGERPVSAEVAARLLDQTCPRPPVTARLWRRWRAAVADLLLLSLPPLAVGIAYLRMTHHFLTTLLYDSPFGRVALGIVGLGWTLAYLVFLADRRGRTLGQRLEEIFTVGRDGKEASRRQLLVRALIAWGPVWVLMAIQPDWPPVFDPELAVYEPLIRTRGEAAAIGPGIRLMVSSNGPLILAGVWVLLLAAMSALGRRRNLADWVSGTAIVEPAPAAAVRVATGNSGGTVGFRSSSPWRAAAKVSVVATAFAFLAFALLQAEPPWAGVATPWLNETLRAGDPGWDRLRSRFERWALAAEERLLEPVQLVFKRRFFLPLFWANTEAPVRIENRAFGTIAEHSGRGWWAFGYAGGHSASVGEMAARDSAEARRWDVNRRAAYRGSYIHFMRALMHQRLASEGFTVLNPESFKALVRQGEGFLLVAWPRLDVKVSGSSAPRSIALYSGFLDVDPYGDCGGAWGLDGWTWRYDIPGSSKVRYAVEQDSAWGRKTSDIGEVTELR